MSEHNIESRKYKFLIYSIIVALIVLIIVISAILFSILSKLSNPFESNYEEKSGVSLYTEKIYLQYEDGKYIEDMMLSLPFAYEKEINEFWYFDNNKNSMINYYPNIFAVEISITKEQYNNIKKEIAVDDKYIATGYSHSYYLYNFDCLPSDIVGCFAFSDDDYTIRCIMITNMDEPLRSKDEIMIIISRYTSSKWYRN
ncbi:MAG: hypothetical protein IJW76_05770 [Clostridia bacterium]|nr:hypothetical protein [Clostridia bacterium]